MSFVINNQYAFLKCTSSSFNSKFVQVYLKQGTSLFI